MLRFTRLVVVFATFLFVGLPIISQAQTLTSPVIVASGKMLGQGEEIKETTLYTPSETGLFRISVYMFMTKPGVLNRDWVFGLYWTDDAGPEFDQLADLVMHVHPPNGFALSYINPAGYAFEAVAGQPISFTVVPTLGKGSKGTYSLYYTVEQIQ